MKILKAAGPMPFFIAGEDGAGTSRGTSAGTGCGSTREYIEIHTARVWEGAPAIRKLRFPIGQDFEWAPQLRRRKNRNNRSRGMKGRSSSAERESTSTSDESSTTTFLGSSSTSSSSSSEGTSIFVEEGGHQPDDSYLLSKEDDFHTSNKSEAGAGLVHPTAADLPPVKKEIPHHGQTLSWPKQRIIMPWGERCIIPGEEWTELPETYEEQEKMDAAMDTKILSR